MDNQMVGLLKNAGVKQETIDILQEEEFHTADIIKDATDSLLKSCNIKGGQIVRIRKALANFTRAEDNHQTTSGNLMSTPSQIEAIDSETSAGVSVPLNSVSPTTSSVTLHEPCGEAYKSRKTSTRVGTSLLNSITHPNRYGSYFLNKEGLKKDWIQDFQIPDSYSLTVEDHLNAGRLTGTVRDEFTRNICIAISKHTMNPTKDEKDRVARLIVQKYPFLEDTSGAGVGSWSSAIGNRFRNMRRTKRPARGVRSKMEKLPGSSLKKRKLRNEMVVSFPDGETPETCAKNEQIMQQEMERDGGQNASLISQLMTLTFPYRRQTILLASKQVHDVLADYPALQLVSEIISEFDRILSTTNIVNDMVENYKSVHYNILNMASRSTNNKVKKLLGEMEDFIANQPDLRTDIEYTASFLLLQMFLKENAADHDLFFSICSDDISFEETINSTNYPRLVGCGNMARLHPLVVAVEGRVVTTLSDLIDNQMPMAIALLLSIFHIFNIDYTPGACSIFAFLEAIMLKQHELGNRRVSVQKMLNEIKG